MTKLQETRDSLLQRVGDFGDQDSWSDFLEIYSPMIYRIARSQGLQHNDAEDLTQSVLVSVTGVIGKWRRDPNRAGFRSWLSRVTRNAIVNAVTRGPKVSAIGGSDFYEKLVVVADPADELAERIDNEYRRSVFRVAAARVRSCVDQATWNAFWNTTIEQQSPDKVAGELKMSVGAVYSAKARVMRRLQSISSEIKSELEDGWLDKRGSRS